MNPSMSCNGHGPVRPPPVVPCRHGDAEANEEEVDEDDPDAGIEVDVYEGSSIKRNGSPQE